MVVDPALKFLQSGFPNILVAGGEFLLADRSRGTIYRVSLFSSFVSYAIPMAFFQIVPFVAVVWSHVFIAELFLTLPQHGSSGRRKMMERKC